MTQINTNNLIYNDTNEVRLFSSEQFNWCLDKETGISCCWGKTAKDTPDYDPCGPQQIVWKITKFVLLDYIKYFNFLTNIKEKNNDNVTDVIDVTNYKNDMAKYICMSTFGNIIFILDNVSNINKEDFKEFISYIKHFNITPKFQVKYNDVKNIKEFLQLSNNIIVEVTDDFISSDILNLITYLKENKINSSLKIFVNDNSINNFSKLISKIDNEINCVLYFTTPHINTRKFLEIQSKCLKYKLTNICISQCSKKYYSKNIIGSLILQLPCSYGKYSIYIEDDIIYTCEIAKIKIGSINEFTTIHDFWFSDKISSLRENLIDKIYCNYEV